MEVVSLGPTRNAYRATVRAAVDEVSLAAIAQDAARFFGLRRDVLDLIPVPTAWDTQMDFALVVGRSAHALWMPLSLVEIRADRIEYAHGTDPLTVRWERIDEVYEVVLEFACDAVKGNGDAGWRHGLLPWLETLINTAAAADSPTTQFEGAKVHPSPQGSWRRGVRVRELIPNATPEEVYAAALNEVGDDVVCRDVPSSNGRLHAHLIRRADRIRLALWEREVDAPHGWKSRSITGPFAGQIDTLTLSAAAGGTQLLRVLTPPAGDWPLGFRRKQRRELRIWLSELQATLAAPTSHAG